MVNHEIMKLDPTKSGQRRKRHTSTYHQWMYSFKNRKKYQTKKMAVMITVKSPIATIPHLIGKHPQHEESLVNSFEQTHSQQQHGSKIGAAYGSSSWGLFFLGGFSAAAGAASGSAAAGSSAAGSSAGCSAAPSSAGASAAAASPSPPSKRRSVSVG